MRSYIAGDSVVVARAFWDPDANGGAGAEYIEKVPQVTTLLDYIDYMEKRMAKLENDFQNYILLEKKND